MIGSNLDTCSRGSPLMKLVGYEKDREDTVGGAEHGEYTYTYTHRVPRDTQVDGASGNDRKQS